MGAANCVSPSGLSCSPFLPTFPFSLSFRLLSLFSRFLSSSSSRLSLQLASTRPSSAVSTPRSQPSVGYVLHPTILPLSHRILLSFRLSPRYNLQTPLNASSRFKPPKPVEPFVPGCKDFEVSRKLEHHRLYHPFLS